MTEIRKVAVFGAGVMGAGIAAHIANAGLPVVLFDIAEKGNPEHNAVAARAIARLLTADPAPLMHRRNAELIEPANIDDHLALLADCDWIVEAIIERADAKRDLYAKLERARKPGSIVSSNTSTIPLGTLLEGLPASFARDFLITHFFNPPRYLRLLEVVPGPLTREDAVRAIMDFADIRLGKTCVRCKDTPGFIANRIGIYWLQCAVLHAIEDGVTVEEADAVLGPAMGFPKTGVFGLLDVIGLDLVPHVLASMKDLLAPQDAFHEVSREPDLIRRMIAEGFTGRKGKGGFYRKSTAKDKGKEALDLSTGTYRPARDAKLDSVRASRRNGVHALFSHPDKGGRYAWAVMARTLAYAATLVPEIAGDIVSVDEAMRLGYGWKYGPFELIDKLGPAWFAKKLVESQIAVPPLLALAEGRSFYRVEGGRLQYMLTDGGYREVMRPEGVLLLEDVKRRTRALARNVSASIWDIGDGILCLEFHSKMNTLDPFGMAMVRKAEGLVRKRYRALVIYNEGGNFSLGANIGLLLVAMRLRAWFVLRLLIKQGQNAYRRLKYAPFPVVGAPSGMALGGGCEILLHCDAIEAHAESYIGLVEAGVGIIPAWGGCKELLLRRKASREPPFGPMPPVIKSFETIGLASVARSAEEAKDMAFLRPADCIVMNRDRLLAAAKAKALKLAEAYRPPETPVISLPGKTAKAALALALGGLRRLGKATPHDVVVGGELATILSGGDTDTTVSMSEDDLYALECRGFLALARTQESIARVAHMLKTGKPLRN